MAGRVPSRYTVSLSTVGCIKRSASTHIVSDGRCLITDGDPSAGAEPDAWILKYLSNTAAKRFRFNDATCEQTTHGIINIYIGICNVGRRSPESGQQ